MESGLAAEEGTSIARATGLLLAPVTYITLKGIGNKEDADGFGFAAIGGIRIKSLHWGYLQMGYKQESIRNIL